MKIIIQKIITEWSKKSRGALGSKNRNAVPKSLVLPQESISLPENNYFFHIIYFTESDNFKPEKKFFVKQIKFPLCIDSIKIAKNFNNFTINYCHDPARDGAPSRAQSLHKKKLFDLTDKKWAQIIYNGRFTDYDTGEWYYRNVVFNINISDAIDIKTFIRSEPTYTYNNLAPLF